MFDSAMSTPWPSLRIDAMPSLMLGMIAGDSPSNGSSSRSRRGSSVSARAIETILRSPPESWLPPRAAYWRSFGKIAYASSIRSGAPRPCGSSPRRELDVLGDAEVAEDLALLGRVADAEPGDACVSASRRSWRRRSGSTRHRIEEAHHGPKRRRLAGAVAADQADQLAGADVERDAAQDAARLDVDDELFDLQHGCAVRLRGHGPMERCAADGAGRSIALMSSVGSLWLPPPPLLRSMGHPTPPAELRRTP